MGVDPAATEAEPELTGRLRNQLNFGSPEMAANLKFQINPSMGGGYC